MKKTLLLGSLLAASLNAQDALGQYANFVIESPSHNVETLKSNKKMLKVGMQYFYDSADNLDTQLINIPIQALIAKNIYLEASLPFKFVSYTGGSDSGLSDIMIGAGYTFGAIEEGESLHVLGLRYNLDNGDETHTLGALSSSIDFYWDTVGKMSDYTISTGLLFNYGFGYSVVEAGFNSSLLSLGIGHKCLLTEALQTNAILSWYTHYSDTTVLGDIPGTGYDLVDLTLKWDLLTIKETPISFGAKIPLYGTEYNGSDRKSFTFFVSAAGLF